MSKRYNEAMPAKPAKTVSARRSDCPISISLELLGDSWSLLIVRDLMFRGFSRFNEFQNGGEGIATNILSERLQRLECAGIVTKRKDPEDARRFVYRLTSKGIDLAPVLVELALWALRHEDAQAPAKQVREMRTNRETFLANVRAQWEEAGGDS